MSDEIALGPLHHHYLLHLQGLRNSPAVYSHVRERRLLTMADMEKWWNMLAADEGRAVRMFAVKCGEDIVGCAGLTSIDWINRRAELSVYTVPSEHEVEAAQLVIDHAFNNLGLHRIEAETITDKRAELCEALGFRPEGMRVRSYWRGGEFIDSRRWGLIAGAKQ